MARPRFRSCELPHMTAGQRSSLFGEQDVILPASSRAGGEGVEPRCGLELDCTIHSMQMHASAGSFGMNLYLRRVVQPQAHENYRVILKLDGDEFEIGSIGVQLGAAWAWGIDTVIPMRAHEAGGRQRSQGLHEAVQGGLGAVYRRRGQPDRVPEREAAALMLGAEDALKKNPAEAGL